MSEKIWEPSLQHVDAEIKEDNLLYDGFYKVKALTLRHKCFSGEWSAWLKREQLRRSDAGAVLLFDPKQDKVVLVEQFRVGVMGVYPNNSPWLLEVVAGLLEPGEEPEQTVIREAQEEAGCDIKKLFKIGEFFTTPGGFAEKTSLFCGICEAPTGGSIQGVGEEHEDIKVHVLSRQEILSALEQGQLVTSSSTVIALQWLALNFPI